MILTCSECQAQYRLDPAMLGPDGREVRCATCGHVWFQAPEKAHRQQKAAESITETTDTLIEQDDAAFEAILSSVSEATAARPDRASPSEEASPVREEKRKSLPPKQDGVSALPIVTHNPLGVSAPVFGALVFCLCVFISLTVIFAAKKPILRHWPQMALLYKTIGFDIRAPGQGLRISEVTAEQRIENGTKVLVVGGKMTNMSRENIPYPALHVVLKSDMDKVMKTWDLKASSDRIASGGIVPVMLQLPDAPEDGAKIEVSIKGE